MIGTLPSTWKTYASRREPSCEPRLSRSVKLNTCLRFFETPKEEFDDRPRAASRIRSSLSDSNSLNVARPSRLPPVSREGCSRCTTKMEKETLLSARTDRVLAETEVHLVHQLRKALDDLLSSYQASRSRSQARLSTRNVQCFEPKLLPVSHSLDRPNSTRLQTTLPDHTPTFVPRQLERVTLLSLLSIPLPPRSLYKIPSGIVYLPAYLSFVFRVPFSFILSALCSYPCPILPLDSLRGREKEFSFSI